jgi:hypothetical protein
VNGWDRIRIGDAERDSAAWALGEHYAVGRLTEAEYDERSTLAWAARTHADLAPLFADLPQPHGRPAPAPAWMTSQPPPQRPPHPSPQPLQRAPRPRPRWAPWTPVLAVLIVLAVVSMLPWFVVALVLWFGFSHFSSPCATGRRRARWDRAV